MTTNNKTRSYVASSPQPTHFKLALDCNHAPIMSVEEVKASYVENRYNFLMAMEQTIREKRKSGPGKI
jgi:hypothetical protein